MEIVSIYSDKCKKCKKCNKLPDMRADAAFQDRDDEERTQFPI